MLTRKYTYDMSRKDSSCLGFSILEVGQTCVRHPEIGGTGRRVWTLHHKLSVDCSTDFERKAVLCGPLDAHDSCHMTYEVVSK